MLRLPQVLMEVALATERGVEGGWSYGPVERLDKLTCQHLCLARKIGQCVDHKLKTFWNLKRQPLTRVEAGTGVSLGYVLWLLALESNDGHLRPGWQGRASGLNLWW